MKYIDEEISRLREEILKLHEIARKAVELFFKATKDKSIVRDISKLEEISDELEARIQDHCSQFIIRFHPMANDMRFAMGVMRISSAYERIVDLAHEMSLFECELRGKILTAEKTLLAMFDAVKRGFEDSKNLREEMISLDNLIDGIYIEALEEIEEDFRCVEEVLAARHIERIGDLLCKIATRLIYIQTGKWVWVK
jgi:phosphate transport system protein